MRSGLCWLTISQERRARAFFSSDIGLSSFPRFPRRVVAPQSCIVEPRGARHMSQMHYFCFLEEMEVGTFSTPPPQVLEAAELVPAPRGARQPSTVAGSSA